jgi:hypothetical protein
MNIQLPKPIGRPSHNIKYTNVMYCNKEYTIGKVPFKDNHLKFVIDKEDFDKIDGYSWHKSSNNYISQGVIVDGKKKEFYLHNLILNIFDFPGKGSKESVDHINRIGLDNRKENLRIISQSEQNLNQSKKRRIIALPEDSGLIADDIPTHIWYIKPNGSHGDRFAIEFKTENILWKTTASKNVSLKDKLESAKKQLEEYYKSYPYLNPKNEEKLNRINELESSYYDIIKLAD